MKFSYRGPQTISRTDLWFFIIALWVKNQNLGTPPTEVGPGQNSKKLSAAAADPRQGYPHTGIPLLLSIGLVLINALEDLLMGWSSVGSLPRPLKTNYLNYF